MAAQRRMLTSSLGAVAITECDTCTVFFVGENRDEIAETIKKDAFLLVEKQKPKCDIGEGKKRKCDIYA